MALKALDIYKILPKKNCKECGDPTCLTFAMKLASGKGDVTLCPYLDEGARSVLGASTRPPVARAVIGVGGRSLTIGEENVFFRHEKTFVHPPGIFFEVSDTSPDDLILQTTTRVYSEAVTRVGQTLQWSGIAVRCCSGSQSRFADVIAAIEGTGFHLPLVLIADDPVLLEAGLAKCGQFRPLVHAARKTSANAITAIASRYDCPVVVQDPDYSQLLSLSETCAGHGVHEILLDPAPATLRDLLITASRLRSDAIARSHPGAGYPLYVNAGNILGSQAALLLAILKFGGVIVTPPLPTHLALAALTLRQNIFTDPQRPIQMSPGIYRVGNPGPSSPIFLTVNFSLTYFTLEGYLEATGVPCFLFLVDTEGLSVLTAVASGKLNETVIKSAIQKADLEALVSHRTLIIPGYAAQLSGRVEDATGWKVLVGPRDAAEVGEFITREWHA
ncbi:MAG: acetyl-CoA decarbonylase/synthase complex subunit gamma [Methanomicrobiales archaeon]|jgi:acetyl-CoA decarbonylase/synthase complex subunit gamma|nr:acetyl-CoA decarbonylase/synthase complex subunit gamma [Methanomicrobiales archaeon]